jgi:hypothetical protein
MEGREPRRGETGGSAMSKTVDDMPNFDEIGEAELLREGNVFCLREVRYARDLEDGRLSREWVFDAAIRLQEGEPERLNVKEEVGGFFWAMCEVVEDEGQSELLLLSLTSRGVTLTADTEELYTELVTSVAQMGNAGLTDEIIQLVKLAPPGTFKIPEPLRPSSLRSFLAGKTALPTSLAQQTFVEMRSLTIALADGHSGRRWQIKEGETALLHVVKNQPIQVKFAAGTDLLQWWGDPKTNTHDKLREELRHTGFPTVLLAHVVVGLALTQPQVTITIDDLGRLVGMEPRSRKEREEMQAYVWRSLSLLASMPVIGQRRGVYRKPGTREAIELKSEDAFISITGKRWPMQQVAGDGIPPVEVTYVAGPWLDQHRRNRQVLTDFGEVLRIASIPSGKPSGAWAQSIGLALNQRWRERAHTAAITRNGEQSLPAVRFEPFTRGDLLDLFRTEPYFQDVLNSDHPRRAQEYWRVAIDLLKSREVIGFYQELEPLPATRQGWDSAWLKQPLDIRPAREGRAAALEIARHTPPRRRRANSKLAESNSKLAE